MARRTPASLAEVHEILDAAYALAQDVIDQNRRYAVPAVTLAAAEALRDALTEPDPWERDAEEQRP